MESERYNRNMTVNMGSAMNLPISVRQITKEGFCNNSIRKGAQGILRSLPYAVIAKYETIDFVQWNIVNENRGIRWRSRSRPGDA